MYCHSAAEPQPIRLPLPQRLGRVADEALAYNSLVIVSGSLSPKDWGEWRNFVQAAKKLSDSGTTLRVGGLGTAPRRVKLSNWRQQP